MKKQENKKIIGYKLIKQEYEKAAIAIVNSSVGLWNDKINFSDNDTWYNEFKNAGVLDIWFTPIYKEEPIPEYVECTNWIGDLFIVKKVYKVSELSKNINPFDNHKHCFKPSTKEAYDLQNQPKFEVGKWYKITAFSNNVVYFIKYLKSENEAIFVSDFITCFGDFGLFGQFTNVNILKSECVLQEIQQYLPDDHPDKIVKEVDWTKATKEELLAEAKRRYPLLSVIKGLCGETFTLRGYELQYSNHTRILKASDRDAQYLYKDNKWAEIIEQPKKAPYTPGMRTPDIGPYYGKTELFSKEQLEVINKMIDDKVKELQ